MNRSTKLLIVLCATASIVLAGCGNGTQNTNTSANGGVRQDNNSNANGNANALPSPPVPTPTGMGPGTPDPSANACDPSVVPATRATNVETWLNDKITQEGALKEIKQLRDNNKLKVRVLVFPPASGGSTDSLVLVLGGLIYGKNVFQELNVLTQPVMGRKCVMAVALVPYAKANKGLAVTWNVDDGMVWTGCDYPAYACPDGTCATSCNGGIGGQLFIDSGNANSGNGGNGNSNIGTTNSSKP